MTYIYGDTKADILKDWLYVWLIRDFWLLALILVSEAIVAFAVGEGVKIAALYFFSVNADVLRISVTLFLFLVSWDVKYAVDDSVVRSRMGLNGEIQCAGDKPKE